MLHTSAPLIGALALKFIHRRSMVIKGKASVAVKVTEVPVRTKPSVYPAKFAARMSGRSKRVLGELFGLKNFGVNLVTLAPNAVSSIRHAHTVQNLLFRDGVSVKTGERLTHRRVPPPCNRVPIKHPWPAAL